MLPTNIPKVAHCFWYSPDGLPYLRYLSIASFAVLNPDFRLIIYTLDSKVKTGRVFSSHEQSVVHITLDYFSKLLSLPNVSLIKLNKSFLSEIQFDIDTAVHWSDIIRIKLLSSEGGYWLDSDIIFTRSLANSFLGYQQNENIDTIIAHTSLGSVCAYLSHRIGFLASSKDNLFYKHLWTKLLEMQSNSNNYQAYGVNLYNQEFPTSAKIVEIYPELNVLNLPNCAFYSIQLTELFSKRINIASFLSSPYIIGCHWYGGGDQLSDIVYILNEADDVELKLSDMLKHNKSFLLDLFIFAQKIACFIK